VIQDWFNSLASREKVLVVLAGALTILALLVIGVIRPLASSHEMATRALTDKRAVLSDIERVAGRFGPNAGTSAAQASPSGESLVVLIDRTTRSGGLGAYLRRNEPDGNSTIRLRFEDAPFDELITWLVDLQTTQGISVISATTDPGQEPGRVNASLQLSRATAR